MIATDKKDIAQQALQLNRMLAVKIQHKMYLLVVQNVMDSDVEGLNIEFDEEGHVLLTKMTIDLSTADQVMLRGFIPEDVSAAIP